MATLAEMVMVYALNAQLDIDVRRNIWNPFSVNKGSTLFLDQ